MDRCDFWGSTIQPRAGPRTPGASFAILKEASLKRKLARGAMESQDNLKVNNIGLWIQLGLKFVLLRTFNLLEPESSSFYVSHFVLDFLLLVTKRPL